MKKYLALLLMIYSQISFGQTIGVLNANGDLQIDGKIAFRDLEPAEDDSYSRTVGADKSGELIYHINSLTGYNFSDIYYGEMNDVVSTSNTTNINLGLPVVIEVPANTAIYCVINYSIPVYMYANQSTLTNTSASSFLTRRNLTTGAVVDITDGNRKGSFAEHYVGTSDIDNHKGFVLNSKSIDQYENPTNQPVQIEYNIYGVGTNTSSQPVYFGANKNNGSIDMYNGTGTLVIKTYNIFL